MNQAIETTITDDAVMMQGKALKYPLSLDGLVATLGPASRSEQKANIVHVWDRAGLVAYQKPGGPISQITVFFRHLGFSFSPHSSYSGKFTFNKCSIARSTTVTQLNACSPGRPFVVTPGIPLWSATFSPYT